MPLCYRWLCCWPAQCRSVSVCSVHTPRMPPGTSPQNDELPTEPDKHTTTSILQPFSKTTWVSQYQKSKTILVFKEADCDVEVLVWKWNRPDYLQTICTLLQIHNHANISSLNFLWVFFLVPNQQRQGTEGNWPSLAFVNL